MFALAAASSRTAAAPAPDRVETVKSSLQSQRSALETRDSSGANADARDLADAALLILLTGGNEADAERDLSEAFSTEDTNAGSPTYGAIRWRIHDPAVTDANAIEFSAQALGPILNQKEHPLSQQFLDSFRPRIALAVEGVRNHRVPVTYTNIFLMKTVNLILIGQYLKDAGVVREGEADLDAWIDYTRRYGIHEFDSPIYYSTDLDSLVEGYRYAADPGDHKKFAAALEYFWTDIAANFFEGGHRISGPYSRDYDFIGGLGDLNVWLADVGWDKGFTKVPNLGGVFSYDNLRPGGYAPQQSIDELAKSGTREVTSSWDDVPTHERMDWVAQNVAIGCTSGSYSNEDKLFAATFAGPSSSTQISIVPDYQNAPYGAHTGGHKPAHLPPWMGCVERGGAALVTLDINPAIKPGPGGVSTSVLLPADAAIAVDGSPVTPVEGGVPVAANATISATVGQATVAFKLCQSQSLNGVPPTLSLVTDGPALARHTVWLKISHLQPMERTTERHLRLSFLFFAQDSGSAAAATQDVQHTVVDESIRGQVWDAVAHLPGFPLEIQRSATDQRVIFAELINGKPVTRDTLAVNGKDLAGPIWAKL